MRVMKLRRLLHPAPVTWAALAGILVLPGLALLRAAECSATETADSGSVPPGMRVWIDPETGQLSTPPAEVLEAESKKRGAVVPGDDAEEAAELVPSPVPGGGMMLDLRGRHRNFHMEKQ